MFAVKCTQVSGKIILEVHCYCVGGEVGQVVGFVPKVSWDEPQNCGNLLRLSYFPCLLVGTLKDTLESAVLSYRCSLFS